LEHVIVATDRPAAVHLLRAKHAEEGELELLCSVALPFAPRGIARDALRTDTAHVFGSANTLEMRRQGDELAFETARPLPCAHTHSALALAKDHWLYLSAVDRTMTQVRPQGEVEQRTLDALPRCARSLDGHRYVLLRGTPLGGDRIEVWGGDAPHFEMLQSYESAGPVCLDACVADFNRDGHPDLSVLNVGHSQLELRLGAADGGFGSPHTFAAGQVPRRVISWDADRDGWPGWLVLEPDARRITVIENHGGRDATPQSWPTRAAPTAVVLEERKDAPPIAWVLCESDPGVQRFENETRYFESMPARSLISPLVMPHASLRLWAYDLARKELLAFDAEGKLQRAISMPFVQPEGPVAHAGQVVIAERGARMLRVIDPVSLVVTERAILFPLASLIPSHGDTAWVVGIAGEVQRLDEDAAREAIVGAGEILACTTDSKEPVFALLRDRSIFRARIGVEEEFVAELSERPSAVELEVIEGELCFAALCPLAHTLETGPFVPHAAIVRYGVGLGARALAREHGATPAWWIASTFSDAVLRVRSK
jgi:hypothetical protein